jgi:hypothetical protein
VTRFLCAAFGACLLTVSLQASAQSSKDAVCNRAAHDVLQTCQKRIAPVTAPVDPNNLTQAEQKAKDKRTKAWQSCQEKSDRRAATCRL